MFFRGEHMKNFSQKSLAGSLCCPVISFLWGSVRALDALAHGLDFTGNGLFRMSFLGAVLIGGILSAVLTLAFDIHTEYYLDKRLILITAVFAFRVIISMFMVGSSLFYSVLYLLVWGVAYIVLFTKIRDVNTDFGEMTVLILSDPILYWTVGSVMEFGFR